MSIKLYNGYRLPLSEDFDLFQWQEKLQALAKELTEDAARKLREDFNTRVVYALDKDTLGIERLHPDQSPLGAAYRAMEADCAALRSGLRRPSFDTEAEVSWLAVGPRTVLVLLYVGSAEYRDRIIEALGLEDYHYQNQTDPDCSEEEMDARGKAWEEALGGWNNAPSARFHHFTLAESPKHPPPSLVVPKFPTYHESIPLEKRIADQALELLVRESLDPLAQSVREGLGGGVDWGNVSRVVREAAEGQALHPRLMEITEEVRGKLIATPTWEDYRRKPEGRS